MKKLRQRERWSTSIKSQKKMEPGQKYRQSTFRVHTLNHREWQRKLPKFLCRKVSMPHSIICKQQYPLTSSKYQFRKSFGRSENQAMPHSWKQYGWRKAKPNHKLLPVKTPPLLSATIWCRKIVTTFPQRPRSSCYYTYPKSSLRTGSLSSLPFYPSVA